MKTFSQSISLGALIALIGFVASGPAGFLLVQVVHPQPAWVSAAVFVEHYDPIQDVPFYFGFLLVGGMLMLVAGHYLHSDTNEPGKKFALLMSFGLTLVFCAMIILNYVGQTTYVHHLAMDYKPEYDSLIAMVSMANPMSFCWSNEMWGYGILGVATWLMAPFYAGRNKLIYLLLIINGLVSVAAVIFTMISTSWLITPVGLVAYLAWNVLMIVLMILILNFFRKAPVSIK